MQSIIRCIEGISEYSGRAASWIVYIGIIMLSFEVVARYFFNSPTVWAHGYTQRLFGSYFILIGAYTFVHQGHVRIDIIQGKCSERWKNVFDILNCLFLIVWSGILIPSSWNFFMQSFRIREVDEMVLAHPIYWVKFLLFIGMVLIFLQGLSELVKKIMEFINPTTEQAAC
ncbi:MAG: TRAP transporter small permease subunit [Desulfomonilia bacterium]